MVVQDVLVHGQPMINVVVMFVLCSWATPMCVEVEAEAMVTAVEEHGNCECK